MIHTMKVQFLLFILAWSFLFYEDVDCLFLSLERRQHRFMNMNKKKWQNRQEKHIPPKSQSSFESLKTNNEIVAEKKSHNNRNNKEALNLYFRFT